MKLFNWHIPGTPDVSKDTRLQQLETALEKERSTTAALRQQAVTLQSELERVASLKDILKKQVSEYIKRVGELERKVATPEYQKPTHDERTVTLTVSREDFDRIKGTVEGHIENLHGGYASSTDEIIQRYQRLFDRLKTVEREVGKNSGDPTDLKPQAEDGRADDLTRYERHLRKTVAGRTEGKLTPERQQRLEQRIQQAVCQYAETHAREAQAPPRAPMPARRSKDLGQNLDR